LHHVLLFCSTYWTLRGSLGDQTCSSVCLGISRGSYEVATIRSEVAFARANCGSCREVSDVLIMAEK
jgi:hypothetical protein